MRTVGPTVEPEGLGVMAQVEPAQIQPPECDVVGEEESSPTGASREPAQVTRHAGASRGMADALHVPLTGGVLKIPYKTVIDSRGRLARKAHSMSILRLGHVRGWSGKRPLAVLAVLKKATGKSFHVLALHGNDFVERTMPLSLSASPWIRFHSDRRFLTNGRSLYVQYAVRASIGSMVFRRIRGDESDPAFVAEVKPSMHIEAVPDGTLLKRADYRYDRVSPLETSAESETGEGAGRFFITHNGEVHQLLPSDMCAMSKNPGEWHIIRGRNREVIGVMKIGTGYKTISWPEGSDFFPSVDRPSFVRTGDGCVHEVVLVKGMHGLAMGDGRAIAFKIDGSRMAGVPIGEAAREMLHTARHEDPLMLWNALMPREATLGDRVAEKSRPFHYSYKAKFDDHEIWIDVPSSMAEAENYARAVFGIIRSYPWPLLEKVGRISIAGSDMQHHFEVANEDYRAATVCIQSSSVPMNARQLDRFLFPSISRAFSRIAVNWQRQINEAFAEVIEHDAAQTERYTYASEAAALFVLSFAFFTPWETGEDSAWNVAEQFRQRFVDAASYNVFGEFDEDDILSSMWTNIPSNLVPDSRVERVMEAAKILAGFAGELNDRELAIFGARMIHGRGKTHEGLAAEFKLTGNRISQLERLLRSKFARFLRKYVATGMREMRE